MHFKALHNFLLIVLCTIGIGFASAPPAAALTFADNTTAAKTLWCTVPNGQLSVDKSFDVANDGTGAPTITFDQFNDQITSKVTKLSSGNYQIYLTIALKESFTGTVVGTVKTPGGSNTLTVNLKVTFNKPGGTTGSGTITLSHTAFDLNAISSDNEWKTNGKLVRELTVTGTNVSGDITLTISPAGNGLSVSPTTLPSAGGKVTITYKPSAGNTVNSNPYPKLSVSAAKATTQTVELRTQWDGSTHATGVTDVPTIPAGTFDPDIYECKTFTGRTTVSLRWELNNPDDIELKSYSQSVINSELDATTKARMIAWNEAYDKYSAMTYTLFRDGKKIVSDLDITSYVDMNVPEGDHKYYVVAHYRNNRTASSEEKPVKVERDMAITNYVLEEIYNYPIVDQEGYNKLQDKSKAFKAFGTVTNDEAGVNREGFLYKYNFDGKGDPIDPSQGKASGAPGDGVRQGVFCNGLWYIAMVSNRQATVYDDKDKISRKANALGYAAKEYPSDEVGHILTITADGINNNPLKIRSKLRTLSNQSLAVIPNTQSAWAPYLYFRGYNGEVTNTNVLAGERYFETITDLGGCFSWNVVKHWSAPADIKTEADAHKDIAQYYRTHYMAARGNVPEGTGKLCFAMNMSHDAYIVDLDNNGNPTAYHKITAPTTAITAAGKTVDIDAGTENYIFPVEGEPNKYIHVMRSSGIFLVNVTDINNPVYTLISSDQSEVTSASGLTFTLENTMDGSTDLFYIHGTSIYSNNSGHFRIDMPQRTMNDGKYTGDIHTANFSDMVPMASKLQDAIPGFDAGNSNGMWFGTKDATEDGIAVKYIYQYVPGVRFAKYKFYPVQAFPPAQPTIDVVIRHDDPAKDATPHEADDITHFDIAYQWKRPANFGSLQGAAKNFKIDGYNYELLDPNGNVLQKGYETAKAGEDDNTVYGPFYYNQHKPEAGKDKIDFSSHKPDTARPAGIFDVHDGKYTIRVTPVYASTADPSRKYTGENGLAQDATDYTPEILNIRAKLFQAQRNKNLYRVDIDFNRAPRHDGETSFAKPGDKEKDYTFYNGDGVAANHLLAEPASRFILEVSKNGGKTWQAIDNLRVFYDGKILINKNNSAEKTEIDKINANITEHQGEIHSGEHDGFIKHDYNFGGNFSVRPGRSNVKARSARQLDTDGDKMYVQEAIAHLYGDVSTVNQTVLDKEKENGAFQAVAYHMIDASSMTDAEKAKIRNWKYRATALYADNQPYASIKRSASVETTLGEPTTTGVEDAIADAAEGVHIWPVPAESELHIAAGEAIESVSIYNISGSCVASFEGNGDTTMTVSVDNLASGVYFVKVNANAAQRLIKR